MKKTILAIVMILTLSLLAGSAGTASAIALNPAQFPYSIFSTPDLMYMGSNTGTESGVPCALEATYDNRILVWFQANGFSEASICVAVSPNDPSETVNTSTYLSSSQKNYIGVQVTEGICEPFFAMLSIKPAQWSGWNDHVPGLTTGTANPVVGISMIKLLDSAIADSAGYNYETVASALFSAGFMLDNKGYWVNQCYGGPFVIQIPQ